ncbi:hypothetical protein BCR33DRAFT_737117 [Rhizoclosmatium globosum]|uniref:Uncharacterized protein n=1 Tax=Rhizoclosmatium globosum TaxID=329046 RepID=A0A1Y2CG48_9FUNG|nr:hypothetical protein BCR33DRAFT_737117 [Rhizoclosmatium globosum]|eukprot:ORY46011.1 hypothetical protein BCR33DRAFT_737117 [Rhizoclosmatium globosum]
MPPKSTARKKATAAAAARWKKDVPIESELLESDSPDSDDSNSEPLELEPIAVAKVPEVLAQLTTVNDLKWTHAAELIVSESYAFGDSEHTRRRHTAQHNNTIPARGSKTLHKYFPMPSKCSPLNLISGFKKLQLQVVSTQLAD